MADEIPLQNVVRLERDVAADEAELDVIAPPPAEPATEPAVDPNAAADDTEDTGE